MSICLVFAMVLLQAPQPEPTPLRVTRNMPDTALSPYMSYLIDEIGLLGLVEVRAQVKTMHPLGAGQEDFGILPAPVWFHFVLENPSSSKISLHLVAGFPQLDEIIVYAANEDGHYLPTMMGDGLPYSRRPVMTRYFTLPMEVQPGLNHYFVRIKTTSALSAHLAVIGPEEHLIRAHREQLILGVFYGLALGLILYNLLLFFTTWERAYLWFSAFALFSTFYIANLDGLTFVLWPNAIYWQQRSVFVLISISLFFMILFERAYLGADIRSLPDLLNLALMVLSLIWVPILLASNVTFGLQLITIYSPLVYFYQILIGLIHFRQKKEMAIYYLVAWSGLMLFVVFSSLAARGLIPGFHFLAPYSLKLGMVLVLVLLSIGMGHRINMLKKQRLEEQKLVLVARAESEAKSLFLARMSHELRTPMNAVLGSAELLDDTPLDQEQRTYLCAIRSSGDALLSTINDVLDFSKLEAGKMELEEVSFHLEELLREITQIFKISFGSPDLFFSYWIRPGTQAVFIGDRIRIRQVLLNLVGNAAKFTKKGSVTIRASVEDPEDGHQLMKIEVWDSGIGITREDRDRLFQPFMQHDVSTSRKFGGTGLGLSISQQLATLMGGQIQIKSQLGQGSCFTFSLLVKPCPEQVSQAEPDLLSVEIGPTLEGMRVLVAEDNKVNRMVIRGFLKKLGVQATFAENGRAALDSYGSDPAAVDLVLMDCEMPELDGYGATRAIRKLEQELGLQQVPIVALTAHALEVHRRQCLEAGMTSFLSKPIQQQVLAAELMRLYQPRRQG